MTKRGRQPGSVIRDNMIEILYFLGPSYGYDLYKKYKKAFGPVSLRSIYHHLAKGCDIGVFELRGVVKIEGEFSWGAGVQRRLFGLTSAAQPKGDPKIKEALNQ